MPDPARSVASVGVLLALQAVPSLAAAAPTLDVTGACPGVVDPKLHVTHTCVP